MTTLVTPIVHTYVYKVYTDGTFGRFNCSVSIYVKLQDYGLS